MPRKEKIPFFPFVVVHRHGRDEHTASSSVLVMFFDVRPVDNPIVIVQGCLQSSPKNTQTKDMFSVLANSFFLNFPMI